MGLVLPERSRRAFDRLTADAKRVFGDRFVALVAYEPAAGLIFAASVTPGDLDALAVLAETWHRDGLRTPLVMTEAELERSVDAFPLEYQAIVDRHLVLAGRSPFSGISVAPADLRRACEVQARAHLIHLREGWIESAGHTGELAELLERSAGPLRVLLANVARLNGTTDGEAGTLADWAEASIGMPADLLRALLALETAPERSQALVARLPEYLTAMERLWRFIDAWRSR
jgi:hypothetical protein